MRKSRFVAGCILSVSVLLVPVLCRAESACVTQWGKLAVLTIPGHPLVSDVRITTWNISANQAKVQFGVLIVFRIARDANGNVSIQGPMIYGDPEKPYLPENPKSLERSGEKKSWQMVLCDPGSGTTTSYQHSSALANHQAFVFKGNGMIPGFMPHAPLTRNRLGSRSRWTDLGSKQEAGNELHGYRWWERDDHGGVEEANYTEQWIAESLGTEYSITKVAADREERTEMVNLRQVEPDPLLFKIPADYEVVDKSPVSPGR